MKTITKVIIGLLVVFAAFKMFAGGACSGGTKNVVAPAPVVNNNVQVTVTQVQMPRGPKKSGYDTQEEAKKVAKALGGKVTIIKGRYHVIQRSQTKAKINTGRRDTNRRKTGRR